MSAVPEAKIYDPRGPDDFRIENRLAGKMFSSQEHGFWFVESQRLENWANLRTPLETLILSTSRMGFFIATPWTPGRKRLRAEIAERFGKVDEFENSVCGYFKHNDGSLETLIQLRNEFGASGSGEWGFGGCQECFSPPSRLSNTQAQAWDFFHILSQHDRIGCFLYLGEMAQSTLVVKPFDGWEPTLSNLAPQV